MSDFLRHECGIAVLRLKKDLAYFQSQKRGTLYGFERLFLLLEKQHNRGHDGMGIGCVKLGMPKGQPYMFRYRNADKDSLIDSFNRQLKILSKTARREGFDQNDPRKVKERFEFGGEILLGHLRYGTSGSFGEGSCHPYVRRSSWEARSLMVCGNFNMANAHYLNELLIKRGQHPVWGTDTQTVLEEIGFHLDDAHAAQRSAERQGEPETKLDLLGVLQKSAKHWDGGYTIAGAIGSGEIFVMRDPNGIRPCFYFENDELIGFASERVPLLTVFNLEKSDVHALPPGHAAIVSSDGQLQVSRFAPEREHRPCSFERIYFSRGNDPVIYQERKKLGERLVPRIMEEIGGDFDNTVFSFIPNTAEIAYYGMMDGLRKFQREIVKKKLLEASAEGTLEQAIDQWVIRDNSWPKGEKIAHKDIKMRTFISQEKDRKQLVSHVYDITYEQVREGMNLVVLDDSIVRGTTLKESIIRILARTRPGKIIIVSTAPQIRFPDCYGIDMAVMGKFIAFEAIMAVVKEKFGPQIIWQMESSCKAELAKPAPECRNGLIPFFEKIDTREVEEKIAELVRANDLNFPGEIKVIYQTVEDLRDALGGNCGTWYFDGEYPTPGGYVMVNKAFLKFLKNDNGRAYDLFPTAE